MIDTDDTIEIENQDNLELTTHPHQMGTDTQVRIAKEQSSIFELLRREERGDLVLAPDFQRKNVWDRKHQSELIESILMGIPIPLIYSGTHCSCGIYNCLGIVWESCLDDFPINYGSNQRNQCSASLPLKCCDKIFSPRK